MPSKAACARLKTECRRFTVRSIVDRPDSTDVSCLLYGNNRYEPAVTRELFFLS